MDRRTRAVLMKDKVLRSLIAQHALPELAHGRDPFEALCRAIVGQQLSVKAAATIYERFKRLFTTITPRAIQGAREDTLRSVGLSSQKVSYVKDLAEKFLDGTIEPLAFGSMSDDEIRAHLVQVKGVGRWTADMFLMFTLQRPDVLPVGDLGIRIAMKRLYRLRELPKPERMEKIAASWAPYRTIACRYLWMSLDNESK